MPERRPPAGVVTLLFTDIEGSTRLLERLGRRYDAVLGDHRGILRGAIAAHGGHEVRTQGDGFFVAFASAADAVSAAVAAQRALGTRTWPDGMAVRVRMGMHTGEPRVLADDYVGMDVHQAARICSVAHGAQVVVSEATGRLVATGALDGVRLYDLGEHRLKDLGRAIRLHQVVADGLIDDFPPLRSLAVASRRTRPRWACGCATGIRRRPGCC
jgi:class 3 adenylate cyclase